MRLRWRLISGYLLILFSALFLFYLWGESWLRGFHLQMARRQLEDQLQMLQALVDADDPDIDAKVDQAGTRLSSRITLMDRSGKVLADSAFSGAQLAALDNHLNRPEVQQAVREGKGSSTRYSTSVDEQLLYVAVALPEGRGVLRLATSLQMVEARLTELRWALAWRGGVLAVLGLFVCVWAAQRWTRSIGVLEAAAEEMAKGRLDTSIAISARDELAGLAESLRSMSQQRRQLVLSLEEERRFLEAVLNSSSEGILVCDPTGKIGYANSAFLEIFACRESPVGKLALEIVRQPQIQRRVESVLQSGSTAAEELQVGNMTLAARFSPIRPASARGAVVAVFHDVSELRRLEQIRQDFVSNISHELRTPLTAIQGYSETLENRAEGLSQQQLRFVEKIGRNARQLADIVQALLDLSGIEGGRLSLRREVIPVSELQRELEKSFLDRIRDKQLDWAFEAGSTRTLTASRTLLLRALHNLIDNAVCYTETGGIQVRIVPANGDLEFQVADTGMGIPESDQHRVFERFYRVAGSRQATKGSGIGLSIVKHVVALHGGRIWLESRLGQGTRVRFTLPQEVPADASATEVRS